MAFVSREAGMMLEVFLCVVSAPVVFDVQMEMERALLEGEQQIQLEHLESAKEKVTSLEAKESRLLAEAAAERAKV